MKFYFKVINSRIISGGCPYGFTGNVNTYICHFDIECDIQGLMWFCVFKQGESVYRQFIENGACIIPQEVLKNPEPLYIGCYGTDAEENIKRISTNLIRIDIKQGAYSESTMPDVPSPDVWETLVSKTIPIIGENGNWFVYDIISEQYIDTGKPSQGSGGGTGGSNGATFVPSISEEGMLSWTNDKGLPNPDPVKIVGEDGYTPKRGTDYWTEEDKAEIVKDVEDELEIDSKLKGKQDKLTTEQLADIDDIGNIRQQVDFAKADVQVAYNAAGSAYYKAEALENSKQDKAIIISGDSTISFSFDFFNNHNKELRFQSVQLAYFEFEDDVYPEDYIAGVSFYSTDNPTTISYSGSGILNWVGTDCSVSSHTDNNGVERQVSIFQPSANTHYDIVFYFNGTQFIGLVNGFKPASGNVVS